METVNFYKTSDGDYIFKDQIRSINTLHINKKGTNYIVTDLDYKVLHTGPIESFLDENDDPYSSIEDLLIAVKGFFSNYDVDIIEAIRTSGGSTFRKFEVEITRPANTTVYSPNDVVADVTAAFKPILNVAKAAGAGVKIVRARIQTEDTGVAGARFNLHLYKEAPTFIADNAPFAVAYANAVKRIGAIPIVMGTGNMNTVGMNDYNQVILNPTSRDVYWILETVSGFTPSANSTRFTISIDCELSN